MNKEKYIASLNLEMNDSIARLVSKMDDTISEVWKIDKKDILEALNFKENLIKYIEDKIEECEDKINKLNITNVYTHFDIAEMYRNKIKIYQDLLERIKKNDWN